MKRNGTEDKRPDPKPRKHPYLWQAYLAWDEFVQMRKRHLLRISSAEAGKSQMDVQFEQDFMEEAQLDPLIDAYKKIMVKYGGTVGPVWDWATSIKGLGEGGMAAQLLAQVDDIGKFDTVSKLWRFCGQAVVEGKAEGKSKGEKAHYNARLKSVCWLIAEQFIRQQTPVYSEIYYAEKERLQRLHPEPVTNPPGSFWKQSWTPAHLHNMAKRKTVKIFLQHLWVTWRQAEGLLVSEPYVQAIMGHTNIITAGE